MINSLFTSISAGLVQQLTNVNPFEFLFDSEGVQLFDSNNESLKSLKS